MELKDIIERQKEQAEAFLMFKHIPESRLINYDLFDVDDIKDLVEETAQIVAREVINKTRSIINNNSYPFRMTNGVMLGDTETILECLQSLENELSEVLSK